MVKARRQAEDDASEAFRDAVKDVTPLPDPGRVMHAPERPPPLPLQRLADDKQVLRESLSGDAFVELKVESGEALAFLRPGMSPQVLRRLRAGFWAVQQELDLHGLRVDDARALLVDFLNGAQRRGARCVRVIHGKGLRSQKGEPVLKRKVGGWLTQRGDVLAFCEARAAEGGGGAVMVLLKGSGRRDEGAEREPEEDDR